MKKTILNIVLAVCLIWVASGCSLPGGNDAGSEYMPDMGHSIAYEANYFDDYYYNTWNPEEYYHLSQPRDPVAGTVPRGYAGNYSAGSAQTIITNNGFVPYYYGDTEEERQRATEEIRVNPYPISDKAMARASVLYNTFCGICHGASGNSQGYLVSEENPYAVYPAQPANFLTDEFINASPGRYYHAIMYGRNLMGSYADKLNYEERWQVIHYIRSLQAKEKELTYNENENSLNSYGIPLSKWEGQMPGMRDSIYALGGARIDTTSPPSAN